MDYYFRRINTNDIDSIWSLIQLLNDENAEVSFTDLKEKEDILDYVDNPAELTYVAVSNEEPNRILSLVKGKRSLNIEKSHAAFLSAATHPDARGLGIAGELTNFALNQMKNEGVNIARIYVYSDNKSSIKAVNKLGFIQSGVVLRHHKDYNNGKYVDDLIFHKILEE